MYDDEIEMLVVYDGVPIPTLEKINWNRYNEGKLDDGVQNQN